MIYRTVKFSIPPSPSFAAGKDHVRIVFYYFKELIVMLIQSQFKMRWYHWQVRRLILVWNYYYGCPSTYVPAGCIILKSETFPLAHTYFGAIIMFIGQYLKYLQAEYKRKCL